MSNNSNNDNARSSGRKKGDFGEPSDDSFRNYMANKIDKQREQFGLVIPPPPPPSPPPNTTKAPPPKKILKKTKFTKPINKNNATAKQRTHDSSSNDNNNINGQEVVVEKKSVRFHQNVEVEGVAQVLENLKRRHSSSGGGISSGGKRRVGRSSSGRGSKRRRRKSSQKDNIESNSSSTEFTSIQGVLDSLQKKHDHITSSQRNRRSSTSSQEYRTDDDDDDDTLEDQDSASALKRKKESPRCKGKSILEGLDTDIESAKSPSQATSSPTEVVNTNKPSTPKLKSGHRPDLFFTGVVVLVNGHTNPDATTLMRLLHKHGGDLEKYETHRVTHIIAEQLSAAKANIYKRQKKPIPVCRPEWVTDSVDQGKLLPFGDYLLEDVVDKEFTGTKSVKSFFNTTKSSEESSKDDTNAGNDRKFSPKKDSESRVTSNKWRDRLPSEASYSLNDKVRTTGNDPNFLTSYFANSRLSYIGSFKQRIKPTKNAGCSSPSKEAHKFVLLVDMDCFFASVILRKYPQYKNKPVAVGHCHIARSGNAEEVLSVGKTQKDSSSELSTCNYIARNRGVRKGMFLGDAIVQCPDLVVLPYDFEGYEEVSGIVVDHLQSIAEQYNGCVEVVSCDESYVEIHISPEDCSEGDVYDFVNSLAENIRTDIEKKTECTASIGIGVNKLLAKLAADRIKPNACCVVKDWRGFLDEVPLRDLPGIGRKLEKRLQPHNISTINDVWDLGDDDKVLSEIIGRNSAQKIIQFCQGKDERPITPVVRKSIGAECNYGVRFDDESIYSVDHMIKELAKEVNKRMQSVEVMGSKLVLKVMISADPSKMPGKFLGHGKCTSHSASQDIQLTRDDAIISSAAMKLYKKLNVEDSSLRGMGIVVQSLRFDNEVNSSPSKLSAWLQKDTATTTSTSVSKSKQLTEDVASGSHVAFEDFDDDDDDNDMTNMSSVVPTFSQLDKDVLESLPDDILLEVKSIYGKKKSSQQSPSQQLSPLKSSNKTKGKAKRDVVSIAGQPSVTRMFKLASVKCGDEEMGDNDLSLSQLDCLPLEVQLQIANGDDVEVTRRPRQSPKSNKTIVGDQMIDTNEMLPNSMKNQDCYTAEDSSTVNFHEENIVPLLKFISTNPNPDESAVSVVHDFLSCIIQERRIEHTTIFLRTIKNNMKDGWTNDIYKQLRRVAIEEIKQKTGSVLDVRWLGL